jgi:hypothetical protein
MHLVDALDWLGHLLEDRREFFESRVQGGCFLEGQRFGRAIAFR